MYQRVVDFPSLSRLPINLKVLLTDQKYLIHDDVSRGYLFSIDGGPGFKTLAIKSRKVFW